MADDVNAVDLEFVPCECKRKAEMLRVGRDPVVSEENDRG